MARLALFSCALLLACGGQVASVGDGGGVDASPIAKDSSSDAPPSVDCNALRTNIDTLSQQARTCCPICNVQQCTHVAQGLCCPISITGDSAPDLDKAVAQYKNLCGPVACPAVPCPAAPSKICPPVSSGPSFCQ